MESIEDFHCKTEGINNFFFYLTSRSNNNILDEMKWKYKYKQQILNINKKKYEQEQQVTTNKTVS